MAAETIVALAMLALAGSPSNPVFSQLLDRGLPANAAGSAVVKFDPPAMADGLDAAAQRKVIEKVSGGRHTLDDLLRNSIVAPFEMKIEDLDVKGASDPFRRVDVYYVAYGSLERFMSDQFLDTLVEQAAADKKSRLPTAKGMVKESELRQRGIEVKETDDFKDQYRYATVGLFDKVLLSETRRLTATKGDGSVVIAAAVDPRFTGDKKYPNVWRPVKGEPGESPTIGPPQPYEGSAAYIKITRLHEPAGALFIEYHQVFAEPEAWFGGRNVLRSKLPLAVQDSVRTVRRQLRTPEL